MRIVMLSLVGLIVSQCLSTVNAAGDVITLEPIDVQRSSVTGTKEECVLVVWSLPTQLQAEGVSIDEALLDYQAGSTWSSRIEFVLRSRRPALHCVQGSENEQSLGAEPVLAKWELEEMDYQLGGQGRVRFDLRQLVVAAVADREAKVEILVLSDGILIETLANHLKSSTLTIFYGATRPVR